MNQACKRMVSKLAVCLMLIGFVGCESSDRFLNENDQLRETNLELENEVESLQRELAMRAQELETMRRHAATRDGEDMGEDVEVPVLSKVHFGRYSSVLAATDDQPCVIRVYLETQDQKNRFMPVAGIARLQAAILEPGQEPKVVAEKTWDPSAFDRAYRESFFGRHYTLEVPLLETIDASVDQIAVRITFQQARTGIVLSTQQAMSLR